MRATSSERQGLTVAFCAPSGSGKSFLARAVRDALPNTFNEEVVATTRRSRYGHAEPNRQCMSDSQFDQAVGDGSVVLPHRPFGDPSTPRYGFLAELLEPNRVTLTEVHATLIRPFREIVTMRHLLIIGVTVPSEVLSANLGVRHQDNDDGVSAELRLDQAQAERDLIFEAAHMGIIDAIVPYAPENRSASEALVADCVRGLIQRVGVDHGR